MAIDLSVYRARYSTASLVTSLRSTVLWYLRMSMNVYSIVFWSPGDAMQSITTEVDQKQASPTHSSDDRGGGNVGGM